MLRTIRALTLLHTVAALSTESRAVAAANAKLAAHLAQLKARKRAQGEAQIEQREGQICEQLGIPSLRPFQRSVLTHLGVLDDGIDRPAAGGQLGSAAPREDARQKKNPSSK